MTDPAADARASDCELLEQFLAGDGAAFEALVRRHERLVRSAAARVLTDPNDARVSASVQAAYVEALRGVGVAVDHRFLPATGKLRHDLQLPGILAAFTWLANR